jgi:hypothetical protein
MKVMLRLLPLILFGCITIEKAYCQDDEETPLTAKEALAIATEAYIFGYPLVTMEMTRRVTTNVPRSEGGRGPMFQFSHLRTYPTPDFKDVTTPNADTLYSIAWLDLTREPWILTLPDMKGRYFLMPMLSAWTEVFAAPGTRTTGTKKQRFLISGPGWKGEVPKGVQHLQAPTNIVLLLGRTYCSGTVDDYYTVHALQEKFKLAPLNAYKRPYAAPVGKINSKIDMKTPVRDQVNAMDAETFFNLLAYAMEKNPPAKEDAPTIKKMAKIGIIPGMSFELSRFTAENAKAVEKAPALALKKIMAHKKVSGKEVNGWLITTKTGHYGTDYLQRALIAAIGLGANLPEDAVYPLASADGIGKKLNGAHEYVLKFAKGKTPPSKGFWSLTMYTPDYFFVPNSKHKYTVSPRDDLTFNKNGSLSLYIQHKSPGKAKEANWLPAPKGDFLLMLRLYWNTTTPPTIIGGSWKPPAIMRIT